jgi:hypothetical protein
MAGVGTYADAATRAGIVDVAGRAVRVVSLDDLLRAKRAANRPKDQAHVAELEAIRDLSAPQ